MKKFLALLLALVLCVGLLPLSALADDSAPEEAPAEELIAEENPAEEPIAEEAPTEESLAEETPTGESLAEEAPTEEALAEEDPDEVPAPVDASEAVNALAEALTVFSDGAADASDYIINEDFILGTWHTELTKTIGLDKVEGKCDVTFTSFAPNEPSPNTDLVGAWYFTCIAEGGIFKTTVVPGPLYSAVSIATDGETEGVFNITGRLWIDPATGVVEDITIGNSSDSAFDMVAEYATPSVVLDCASREVHTTVDVHYIVNMSVSLICSKVGGIADGHYAVRHVAAKHPCTETGNIEYWCCDNCGKYYGDAAYTRSISPEETVLASLGHHSLTHHDAVTADCTAEGSIEYWDCSVCGKLFSDSKAENETSADVVFQPKLSHVSLHHDAVAASTCTVQGHPEYWSCERCGGLFLTEDCAEAVSAESVFLPLLPHSTEHHPAQLPGELPGNVEYWYCPVCEGYFLDEACTITTTAEDIVIPVSAEPIVYKNLDDMKDLFGELVSFPERQDTYNSYTGLAVGTPVRTGYVFNGWYLDSKCTKPLEDGFIPVGTTGTVTLWAKWTVCTYTVSFDKNADAATGSMKEQKHTCGKELALSSNAFKRSGFTFAGWNTMPDGSGESYANKAKVKNLSYDEGAVVTLYAQWEPISYKISYKNVLADDVNPNPVSYTGLDSTITLISLSRQGWDFGGWYLDSGFKKPVTELATDQAKAFTVYAKWTAHTYTVVFDKNADTATGTVKDQKQTCGKEAALSSNGYKLTGYVFTAWNTAPDGSGVSFANKAKVRDLSYDDGAVVTLYAQWAPNSYTVTYNGNGGKYTVPATGKTASSYTQGFVYDAEAALDPNLFAKTGYSFIGWNTVSKGTGKAFSDGETGIFNLSSAAKGKATLYAQWRANSYTIAFDLSGADGSMASIPTAYDKTVKLPACVARGGYSFTGWYCAETGKTIKDKSSVKNLSALDGGTVTLIAQWSPNTYTVTFNMNGGKYSADKTTFAKQSCAYNAVSLRIPEAVPVFDAKGFSYRFVGWSADKNADESGGYVIYAPGEVVNYPAAKNKASVTLYAIWAYEAVFTDPASGGSKTVTLYYNKSCSVDQKTCGFTGETGYEIAGWALTEANAAKGSIKYKNNAVKNVGQNTVLYAIWKPVTYKVIFHSNTDAAEKTKTQSITYGKETALTSNGFSWKGHSFLGWAETAGGAVKYLNKEKVLNLSSDADTPVDLYAIWG